MAQSSIKVISTAKTNLKQQVGTRLCKRISSMETIINQHIPSTAKRFVMDETNIQSICDNIFNKIDEYNGRTKSKNNDEKQKSINQHCRKWWNRQKASPLGSFLFAEIIVRQLPQFIQRECNLTPLEQLILFIDIFQGFIKHEIQLPKTKPKPLILQTCFYADSDFKTCCYEFVRIFGDEQTKWNPYFKMLVNSVENGKKIWQYKKNPNRCQTLCAAFNKCLDQILFKCKFTNKINAILLNEWYFNVCKIHTGINTNDAPQSPELSAECTISVSDNHTWNEYSVTDNRFFWCTCTCYGSTSTMYI